MANRSIEVAVAPEKSERMYTIEIPIIARIGVAAGSEEEARDMAAQLFGAGKKSQAVTGDGIPFTARVL